MAFGDRYQARFEFDFRLGEGHALRSASISKRHRTTDVQAPAHERSLVCLVSCSARLCWRSLIAKSPPCSYCAMKKITDT